MKTTALVIAAILAGILLENCRGTEERMNSGNKMTWFSIPTDNMDRAAKFYSSAFNWQIEPLTKEADDEFSFNVMVNSPSDANYISHDKGAVNGCLVRRSIGLPTPAVLVEVENLDEAIRKVKDAGGQVMTDKITMKSLNGVFVLVLDTEGNYVEIFQGLSD